MEEAPHDTHARLQRGPNSDAETPEAAGPYPSTRKSSGWEDDVLEPPLADPGRPRTVEVGRSSRVAGSRYPVTERNTSRRAEIPGR